MWMPHILHMRKHNEWKRPTSFSSAGNANLITEKKSCGEAGCRTWFTKHKGSYLKVPRTF